MRRLKLVRALPTVMRRPIIAASGQLERARRAKSWSRPQPAIELSPGPVVVSGFLNDVSGIGRAGRLTINALSRGGTTPIGHDIRPVILGYPDETFDLPGGPGGVWIVHANAPESDMTLQCLDPATWRSRYRIAYWVWETDVAPSSWRRTARWFHEIWTPSHYCARALKAAFARGGEAHLSKKVRVVPHPVPIGNALSDRPRFGLSAARFTGLVMVDGRSTLARKNPQAAVSAWINAFPTPSGDRELLVKIHSGGRGTDLPPEIDELTVGRSDIRLYSEILSEADMGRLMASIDIYISLHRSEGFGLTVFEAVAQGRPVLATANSAIAEYFDSRQLLAVPSIDVPVSDPSGTYKRGVWGEPDLTIASQHLRAAYENWRMSAAMSAATAQDILLRNMEQWTPETLFGLQRRLIDVTARPPG